ncbi:hypothetical protein AKJ51_04420, partial [candidate division MSBL1 archaeon SCGC-AAA382A20]
MNLVFDFNFNRFLAQSIYNGWMAVQTTLKPYRNKNLFSAHYLDEKLEKLDEWSENEKARKAYEEIKELYERKKERIRTYTSEEANLEKEFIRPILTLLGHYYGVRKTIRRTGRRPDYGFFRSEEEYADADISSTDFYDNAIAIGDAKAWERDLDKEFGKDSYFTYRNPSFQIDHYLRTTKPQWGILTNGIKWRLYVDDIDKPIETYYEVDLIRILEKDNFEDFKFFYFFFRKQAFLPVGDSFLKKVREESEKFAEEIGESLEDDLYNALLWLAKGYFDNSENNNLDITDEEDVKEVHDKSLIFLYRLLFLFYANSGGMLGENIPRQYQSDYSFSWWLDGVLDEVDEDEVSPVGVIHHLNLKSIFEIVGKGSKGIDKIPEEEFEFPAYNGRLFSNEEHEFFKDKRIRSKYLAKVVDLLARRETEEGEKQVRIDYSDLGVKHLGGIYEGLLEYELKSADEKKIAVKENGSLKWVSATEVDKDFSDFDEDNRVEENELYLITDKEERKATGSYYTPQYIVEYIVNNTLEPLIDEKLEGAESIEEKRDKILSTKVLDPAMGSGHFLVGAIDYLTRRLNEFSKEGEDEKDLRRKVARNCIFGVDVNPLATELAKVSIWLHIMDKEKPLSFLDHHLKTGNSLIGADLQELGKHPKKLEEDSEEELEQLTIYGKSFQENIKELLDLFKSISEIDEETPEDIKEQKEFLEKFESHSFKKKFNVLADAWTSYYFGNEFSKKQYWRLRDIIVGEDIEESDVEKLLQKEYVKKVTAKKTEEREDRLSGEKKFFHWKLEFPEVFFDTERGTRRNNPGFDIIVSNPPYLLMENIPKATRDFAYGSKKGSNYVSANRKTNIYALFIEKAYNLLKSGGRMGYINPYSWMGNSSFKPLRTLILKNTAIKEITLLPNDIFEDPDTESSIFLFSKDQPEEAFKGRDLSERDVSNNPDLLTETTFKEFYQEDFLEFPENIITFRLDKEDQRTVSKIREDTEKLENFCRVDLGVKTADDERFTGTFEKENKNSKKLLRGKDFSRYFYYWDGDFIYYEPGKMKENKSTARPGTPERFESPKLIM